MLACYFHIAASLFQLKICQSGIRESQKFSKHLLVVRTGIEPPEYFLVFPKYGIFMETVGNNHIRQILCGIGYRLAGRILQEL